MDDALDEADEIYQMVHEGFKSIDQEFLMDLFSMDDYDADYKSQRKDSVAVVQDKLTQLDTEIDELGKVIETNLKAFLIF
jgi:hypothetical protein